MLRSVYGGGLVVKLKGWSMDGNRFHGNPDGSVSIVHSILLLDLNMQQQVWLLVFSVYKLIQIQLWEL